jgi:hypothetical protein
MSHFRPHQEPLPVSHRVIADNSAGLYASVPFSSTPQDRTVRVNITVSAGFLSLEVATRRINAYIPPWQISDP